METRKRFNTMWAGLLPGLILPFLVLLLIWAIRSNQELGTFLRVFQKDGNLAKVMALSAVPNLLLFYIFIWTRRSFSARGVILATLVLAGLILVLKFA